MVPHTQLLTRLWVWATPHTQGKSCWPKPKYATADQLHVNMQTGPVQGQRHVLQIVYAYKTVTCKAHGRTRQVKGTPGPLGTATAP
jgi:hypothetical protein